MLRALTAALLLVPLAHAQVLPPDSGFTWERVGDAPVDASALALGPDSLGRPGRYTLWASGSEGILRFDDSGGFPGTWVLVQPDPQDQYQADRILPLGPDTLALILGWAWRSTDGGATFSLMAEPLVGYDALAEIPAGVPHAGRLLLGAQGGIQFPEDNEYSDDRGETWTAAAVPEWGAAFDFAIFPAGSPHAGRVVAASSFKGVMYSDDGGQTYAESALWAWGTFGEFACIVERPGEPGSARAMVTGYLGSVSGERVWTSDDGVAWTEVAVLELGTYPVDLLALGGPSALWVERNGVVHRTDDAGATWEAVGRAPVPDFGSRVKDAVVGPDGRLYLGVNLPGPDRDWVYRTAEVLTVASEPGPEGPGEGLGLAVSPNPFRGTAEVTLTLPEAGEVEAALYDVLGRRVAPLASGPLAAGRHALPIEGGRLPAGVYVVRVTSTPLSDRAAGGAVAARTVTLLH